MKCILSIDGGGARGVIPSIILGEIEKRIGEKSYKLFDLIACSSMSSIIGGMSVSSRSMGHWGYEITEFIESNIDKIFQKRPLLSPVFNNDLFKARFDPSYYKYIIDDLFQDSELKTTLTNFLCPSYDLAGKQPYIFKTSKANEKLEDNFYLKEVIQAASSAPTIFPPYKLNGKLIIDGNIYANNPSMCGLTEAIKIMPFRGFFLISLGCGSCNADEFYKQLQKRKMFRSSDDILSATIDGVNKTVHYEASQILSSQSYFRLQPILSKRVLSTDSSRETINFLIKTAHEYIADNTILIDKICQAIISTKH